MSTREQLQEFAERLVAANDRDGLRRSLAADSRAWLWAAHCQGQWSVVDGTAITRHAAWDALAVPLDFACTGLKCRVHIERATVMGLSGWVHIELRRAPACCAVQ